MKFIIYLLKWQLTTPVIVLVMNLILFLNVTNDWIRIFIANLVGGVLFFKVDDFIFNKINIGRKDVSTKKDILD